MAVLCFLQNTLLYAPPSRPYYERLVLLLPSNNIIPTQKQHVTERYETKFTSEKSPINSRGDINPTHSQTDKHTDKGEAERARAGPDTNIDS